jgi:hypothetical protein
MPRRAKGVTAAQVEKGTKPGRYGDGAGLYLFGSTSLILIAGSRGRLEPDAGMSAIKVGSPGP